MFATSFACTHVRYLLNLLILLAPSPNEYILSHSINIYLQLSQLTTPYTDTHRRYVSFACQLTCKTLWFNRQCCADKQIHLLQIFQQNKSILQQNVCKLTLKSFTDCVLQWLFLVYLLVWEYLELFTCVKCEQFSKCQQNVEKFQRNRAENHINFP